MTATSEVDDLYLEQRIDDLHAVAALDVAACAVKSIDRDNDGYRSAIRRKRAATALEDGGRRCPRNYPTRASGGCREDRPSSPASTCASASRAAARPCATSSPMRSGE